MNCIGWTVFSAIVVASSQFPSQPVFRKHDLNGLIDPNELRMIPKVSDLQSEHIANRLSKNPFSVDLARPSKEDDIDPPVVLKLLSRKLVFNPTTVDDHRPSSLLPNVVNETGSLFPPFHDILKLLWRKPISYPTTVDDQSSSSLLPNAVNETVSLFCSFHDILKLLWRKPIFDPISDDDHWPVSPLSKDMNEAGSIDQPGDTKKPILFINIHDNSLWDNPNSDHDVDNTGTEDRFGSEYYDFNELLRNLPLSDDDSDTTYDDQQHYDINEARRYLPLSKDDIGTVLPDEINCQCSLTERYLLFTFLGVILICFASVITLCIYKLCRVVRKRCELKTKKYVDSNPQSRNSNIAKFEKYFEPNFTYVDVESEKTMEKASHESDLSTEEKVATDTKPTNSAQ